jgi:hypothetical protein
MFEVLLCVGYYWREARQVVVSTCVFKPTLEIRKLKEEGQ